MARNWLMTCTFAAFAVFAATGCDGKGSTAADRKPAGTPTDPVEVCERVADVCRLDGAKLGVCVAAAPNSASCPDGATACYVCQSQH